MAGKRSATSDLNHENWNYDEEPEERGVFKKASDDALKARVIRTAKRRNPISSVRENNIEEKKNIFASFTAFQSSQPSSDFSFINDVSKSSSIKVNGTEKATNIFSSSGSIFGAVPLTNATIKGTNSNEVITSVPGEGSKHSDTYFSKLKGLNESVSKWIVQKVEENPLISLQPIFNDYKKYLDELENDEQKNGQQEVANSNSTPLFSYSKNMPVPDSTSEKTAENKTVTQFKFGLPEASVSNVVNTKPFSLGTTSGPHTSSFSFGSSSSGVFSNSFGSQSSVKTTEQTAEDNDDDEEPPKVTFTAVVEKDHFYTTRCKVFVKKGDNFSDMGVGSLYLKPIEKTEKVQLIVRADTNLGQLLCNFILSKSLPIKRIGKKDVMLVTIPTPNSQPTPVPILLRVKSSEDADNLLETLEKHKN
ncbi:nuclear pore complex protein Nup50-like [Cylas formicarius]|uniref:nuclear pore complex protein Nup50-like n=1 Tax=Cylas formicarius TaxID=197179 RepID=UPI002958769F|nr:nuclear pore complex protein Nup50-like [Cylas formicarius]XP_060531668.1 nuclear pore complex protein Nup50-like [Cylas formicarius]